MNTSSRYLTTIHILTLMAEKDEPISSTSIARSVGVNPVTIRKAIGKLQHCGLVETVAGSTGGAKLAKHPSKITLKELYLLLGADNPFGLYPQKPDQTCLVGRNLESILDDIHTQAHQEMINALEETTIADVLVKIMKQDME